MTTRAQGQVVFHGTIVLFGGMLAGVPLAAAIVDGRGADAIHAWAVTHSSLVAAGILLLAIGGAGRLLSLGTRESTVLTATLVPSTYALSVGLVVTAATGHRGLGPAGPALNVILYAVNVAAVLGAFVAGVLLIRGAYRVWHAERSHASRYAAVIDAR